MDAPLTKEQNALRGRKLETLSLDELRLWIDGCERMEAWPHTPAKARRGWKASRARAELLLAEMAQSD
jgi:hypothetical protein